MNKEGNFKDAESSLPIDNELDEEMEDNGDNSGDKESSSDSFASCNEERENESSNFETSSINSEPPNDDFADGDNGEEEVVTVQEDDGDELMENDGDSTDDLDIQLETLTEGTTPASSDAQKKLQEERTAVLKKPQTKSRFNFIQDFLSQ